MLRNLIIVLALGLFASTASAQQAYTLKKVCNGRTCYYVKVPVNNTSSYATPSYKSVTNIVPYGAPVVQTTARNRPILGGTVINSRVVGMTSGVTTTVVESLPTPVITTPTITTPTVAAPKITATVAEVPELELLNL